MLLVSIFKKTIALIAAAPKKNGLILRLFWVRQNVKLKAQTSSAQQASVVAEGCFAEGV
jgi:hypothetical protein